MAISALGKEDRARFADVLQGIIEYGLEYDRAQFRQLQGKLWEVKFHSHHGDWRIAYVMLEQDLMFWLHIFKKDSQKTKRQDIELALKRMREVQNG